MSSPKHITKELRRLVKRFARLDHREIWEENALSLEKAARAHETL